MSDITLSKSIIYVTGLPRAGSTFDLVQALDPDFRILVCVRDPAQIYGSIEARHQQTHQTRSQISPPVPHVILDRIQADIHKQFGDIYQLFYPGIQRKTS